MKVIRKDGPAGPILVKVLKELKDVQGKVGWFETAKYPNGTPVAYVAAIQEYGVPEKGIPARATIRPTITKRQAYWNKVIENEAKKIFEGKSTSSQGMERITAVAAGDVRDAIRSLTSPALKPSTIEARKRRYANQGARNPKKLPVMGINKPLVDTGLMLDTVTNIVTEK